MPAHPRSRTRSVSFDVDPLEPRRLLAATPIYATNPAAGTVTEYDSTGATVAPALISGLSTPEGIAVEGSDLFIANSGNGTVAEYTTSGTLVNATLISGLKDPTYITVSGAALFVANQGGVDEYSTTGNAGDTSLLGSFVQVSGIAVTGTHLIVCDPGDGYTYGYDESTFTPSGNPGYLFSLANSASVTAVGGNFFLGLGNSISEETAAGTSVNPDVTATSGTPVAMASDGSNLFVVQQTATSETTSADSIGEYTTGGVTVNAHLVSNGATFGGIAVSGATNTTTLNQLQIVDQPSSGAVGRIGSTIEVYVEDANGNLVTTDNSDVTLSLTYSTSDLGETGQTTVAAVDGIATFKDVSISTANTYSLIALDGGDVPSTSQPFTLTGGGGGGGGAASLSGVVTSTTLPRSAIAGSTKRASALVTITNSGTAAYHNVVTEEIFASLDGVTTPIGTVRADVLARAGGTARVPVPIPSLPGSLSGTYTLLAQTTDVSGNTAEATTGPSIVIAAPFVSLAESVVSTLPPALVSGTTTSGKVLLVISNSGNVASSGSTGIDITASTAAGVPGQSIYDKARFLAVPPNGSRKVTIPITTVPALADGNYFIVAQVTDPFDAKSSVGSTSSPLTVAAPFVQLSVGFASIPRNVVAAGATLLISNTGNIADTGKFTATVGLSTDAGGQNIVGTNTAAHPSPPRLSIKPGKSGKLHVTGWGTLLKSLPSGGPLFLTVTVTDPNGNTVTAVSTGEIS